MAEPINLNKARKAKARAEDQARAAQNRAKFGRTKTERAKAAAEADKLGRALDQARREE